MDAIKQRLYLLILITAAILLSCRIVYFYMANPKNFPITNIKVAASFAHVSQQTIKSIISQYTNESFFSLSSDALSQDIKQLAWVDTVVISRFWPGTLKVTIKEKIPVAKIDSNGLITASGLEFFPPLDTINEDLPELLGPALKHKQLLSVFNQLNTLLQDSGLSIKRLHLSESDAWTVVLNNGMQIKLGNKTPVKRMQRFVKIYPTVSASATKKISGVDLRYSKGVALKWDKR